VGVVADVDAGEGPAVVAARREIVGCTHDNGIIRSVRRSSLRELSLASRKDSRGTWLRNRYDE
jgi:hypothetical protein